MMPIIWFLNSGVVLSRSNFVGLAGGFKRSSRRTNNMVHLPKFHYCFLYSPTRYIKRHPIGQNNQNRTVGFDSFELFDTVHDRNDHASATRMQRGEHSLRCGIIDDCIVQLGAQCATFIVGHSKPIRQSDPLLDVRSGPDNRTVLFGFE